MQALCIESSKFIQNEQTSNGTVFENHKEGGKAWQAHDRIGCRDTIGQRLNPIVDQFDSETEIKGFSCYVRLSTRIEGLCVCLALSKKATSDTTQHT